MTDLVLAALDAALEASWLTLQKINLCDTKQWIA